MKKSFSLFSLIICLTALSCSNLQHNQTVTCSFSLTGEPLKAVSAYETYTDDDGITFFAELKISGDKDITATRTFNTLKEFETEVIVIEDLSVGVEYGFTLNIYLKNSRTESSVRIYTGNGSLTIKPGTNELELQLDRPQVETGFILAAFEEPKLEMTFVFDSDENSVKFISGYDIFITNEYPEGTEFRWYLNGSLIEGNEKSITLMLFSNEFVEKGKNYICVEAFYNINDNQTVYKTAVKDFTVD